MRKIVVDKKGRVRELSYVCPCWWVTANGRCQHRLNEAAMLALFSVRGWRLSPDDVRVAGGSLVMAVLGWGFLWILLAV